MSKKIVLGCVFLCILVFALACGSGSSKVADAVDDLGKAGSNGTPTNNNNPVVYTNTNLVGTWKLTEKGEVTTYTFQNNGTYTISGMEYNNAPYQLFGSYSIQAGNTLMLIGTGFSFTTSIAINGSDLAMPALRVTNLGADGQGPIGSYTMNRTETNQEYLNGTYLTVTNSNISSIQINADHTFVMADVETESGVQITSSQTNSSQTGTWSSSGANITITTTYNSNDPSVTVMNPDVETFPFYHVNNDWVISGPICIKQ